MFSNSNCPSKPTSHPWNANRSLALCAGEIRSISTTDRPERAVKVLTVAGARRRSIPFGGSTPQISQSGPRRTCFLRRLRQLLDLYTTTCALLLTRRQRGGRCGGNATRRRAKRRKRTQPNRPCSARAGRPPRPVTYADQERQQGSLRAARQSVAAR